MSKNSKVKRDKKKKAQLKAARRNDSKPKINSFDPLTARRELEKLFNPCNLTTPNAIDENITTFCKKISDFEPFFLKSEPETWSRQSCCDLNVREYIKKNDGELIAGYKIWYHSPKYIEAERHAVWFKNGSYKDVSFNVDGEEKILFLPDNVEKQATLDGNKKKIRWGKDSKTKQLIDYQEKSESMMPIEQMDNDEAWRTMLTFEDWEKGSRMPNIIQKKYG